MENDALNGYVLDRKAELSVENVNFSSLFYYPIIGDSLLEGFIELGVSDINSDLKFISNGVITRQIDHETAPLYGFGFNFAPYDGNTIFRLSVQKYNTDLSELHSDIVIYRGGIVKYF